MIFFSIKHSLQRSKHYISVTSWMRAWTSFMQLVMAWISLSTQLQSPHSSPRSSTQAALSTNAGSSSTLVTAMVQTAQNAYQSSTSLQYSNNLHSQCSAVSNLNADIYTTLHNHRPIQQSQAQTYTQFIIHVLVLETNMNSYIKLFSLQNMNSYIKNWAKDAPFSSCSVYFSATANSCRKIGQK